MKSLLVVDDNAEIRTQLKWGLKKDYSVHFAGDASEALTLFKKHRPAVVTLDLGLPPDEDGVEQGLFCLTEILILAPSTKVIVVTGRDEKEHALKAVQLGAYDYYQKPIDLYELKVILCRAFHLAELEEENQRLSLSAANCFGKGGGIFGQCPEMVQVFSTINKVACCDVPVLILGESGTGKELVAQAIHDESLRKDNPFVPINCGAIPDNLLESELFGHEKGAFTGAQARLQGKVEYAEKGTLFLDELGELPSALQVKILRFLQERVVQRVGGREDIEVDARIIAATNIDITKAIQSGAFREDLYYRIGVITIQMPPLRDRGEDIFKLARLFLERYSKEYGKNVRAFSREALDWLRDYRWPGNVRELENKIKRAVLMSDAAVIEAADLGFQDFAPPLPERAAEGLTLRAARDRLEREQVTRALAKEGGNILKASKMLGVSRPTLYDLMKKHGLRESVT